MQFAEMPIAQAAGAILAHSVRHASGTFKKGRVLDAADIETLEHSGIAHVFAARLEADDVAEDAAAGTVARALAGAGALAQAPFTGRANLHAASAGIALIDAERIRALNRLHESLTVTTVAPFEIVEDRQMLATVKVIPFAVPRPVLDRALALIAAEPLVKLAPFTAHDVGLVITVLPQTKPQLIEKTKAAIGTRIEALGSRLGDVEEAPHTIAGVRDAVARLLASGHAPVLIFGASAIVDRGDVVPQGLVAAGGEIVHLGMPVDPGNLMLLGRAGQTPVIGVPSCARSPKLNGFDWVLARTLAGLELTPHDIMDMGAGGLLMEIPTRPLPRERNAPNVAKAPNVAALVLAAGRSSRMGGPNKLLATVAGTPMVRRVAETALATAANPVIVVTGHQAAEVEATLAGLDVQIVHNPDYASGLASSLKTGLATLPPETDAFVVCLGDMPLIEPAHIDSLIAAFDPDSRPVCVPVHAGRRGNPVLWSRRYIPNMLALEGDEGARRLLDTHAVAVTEVPVGSDTIFADFDTPEALAGLKSG
ncbi:MAG: NTP transferase domain-containing protein [Hyphomicrobiales bacterium]